jgi:ribosome-associated protein
LDIRKLQRAIVDGLEDVKGQNIAVFNTEHLSPLFERVIIASGTSNRQTKALAASVRDAVKSSGLPVLRTEGEDNGEWIIVDCGAAVAHIMQPAIRQYYHLEELWGSKPVKMKLDGTPKGLPKAEAAHTSKQKITTAKVSGARHGVRPSAAAKPVAKAPAVKKRAAKKAAPARKPITRTIGVKSGAAKKAGTKKAAPTKRLITRTVGVTRTAAKKPGVKTSARKTASTHKVVTRKPLPKKSSSRT